MKNLSKFNKAHVGSAAGAILTMIFAWIDAPEEATEMIPVLIGSLEEAISAAGVLWALVYGVANGDGNESK